MAKAERRRRRKTRPRKKTSATCRTTVHDLPDHIFEQILLRLGPSPCLVRAAATCTRWCRLVADASFLAQLGPAPYLGDYRTVGERLPVFVPSSPENIPFETCRMSLYFLPASRSWDIDDSRGSLLLLSNTDRASDLIVCEPLTGRYQGIPWSWDRETFLLDSGHGADSMSTFRVIAQFNSTMAHVFHAGTDGGWRMVQSPATGFPAGALKHRNLVGRADGSLYWGIDGNSNALLVLNQATMEFSTTVFPKGIWAWCGPSDKQTSRVIGGDDGVPRVVRLIGNDLKIFARLLPGGDDDGWVLEKELSLPKATSGLPGYEGSFFQQGARIVVANTRYILLTPRFKTWLFSIEVDTMKVEREHKRNRYAGAAYPYELPWPPKLPDQR